MQTGAIDRPIVGHELSTMIERKPEEARKRPKALHTYSYGYRGPAIYAERSVKGMIKPFTLETEAPSDTV